LGRREYEEKTMPVLHADLRKGVVGRVGQGRERNVFEEKRTSQLKASKVGFADITGGRGK